ncbi:hypothetical protein DPEC_G00292070 [Dallia pectoralis]|uniref:Uncharacterized protein n=1 Tax=Dallia pectoralis TaxID=75939 RepID=A0ACC2FHM0_DALPE|nr:hypothetical protein DPEC_G00292070 [Dallia pectoralis]
MADNEDESNMSSNVSTTEVDHGTVSEVECVSVLPEIETPAELENPNQVGEKCIETNAPEIMETTDFLQSCTKEETLLAKHSHEAVTEQPEQIMTSVVETSEIAADPHFSPVSADFVNALAPGTTIIYVQPDGSFVEGSGLTAEEQQQLVEQLVKQELVTVSESEAARLFEHNQGIKTLPPTSSHAQYTVPSTALAPNELQQVIEQVTKSQQSIAAPKESEQVVTTLDPATGLFTTVPASEIALASPQPLVTMQNASQQLKNVAKQVSLQSHNGTRLVQKKQETIRIQVQMPPGKQEAKVPTQTTISIPQKKTMAIASQGQQVKVSTNGSVSGSPQIIHITPVVGQQHYFLQQNPGDPPIQLLLQSSAPVVGSLVPVVHKLPVPGQSAPQQPPAKGPINGPTVTVVKSATAAVPAVSASNPAPAVEKVKRVKARVKKAPNIKTRSGRVSRPPKYKVKDYKFIKTEDLAESHQSDSDDYSEISVEEEEDGEGDLKGASSMSYSHKRRAFQCETCDKAYIGHGGLSRHYRLYPSHGEVKSPPEGALKEDTAGAKAEPDKQTESNASAVKDAPVPERSDVTEKTAATTTQPKVDTTATQAVASSTKPAVGQVLVQARGPGRPRGRGRPPTKCLPKVAAHPVVRLGRRGRPPKLGGGAASVELQAQRRRARLKEVTHECDNEELMETVLPRLAKVMTVWEFLLMKVEKARQPKALFSDVYREFEQLHGQVKKMAQDYISNTQSGHAALEVHNVEVAKSLGIFDEVNKLKVLNPPAPQIVASMAAKHVRYMENSKMLPPTKRFKMENRAGSHIQNGIETSRNESSAVKVESSATTNTSDITPETLMPTTTPAGPQATQTVTVKALVVSSNPEPNITPMELIQDHLSNSMTETIDPATGEEPMETAPSASASEPTEVLSTSEIADQMKELEKALSTDPVPVDEQSSSGAAEQPQSNPTPVQQSDLTQDESTPSGDPVVVQEMQSDLTQDESTPSGDPVVVQEMQSDLTQDESTPSGDPVVVQEMQSDLTQGESTPSGDPVVVQEMQSDLTQGESTPSGDQVVVQEAQSDLTQDESTPSGDQVVVQEAQSSQEGQEIYIQTDGLTMHLSEGQEASERIVIVNGPDGTTMHIRAPEGVPLEAVHALLGIESEGKQL